MFDKLIDILKANPRRIVFTEGPDARILEAASRLKKDGFLTPVLVGNVEEVKAAAAKGGFDIEGLEIIDPLTYDKMDEMVDAMVALRKGKMTPEECRELLKKGNYFGTMLVKMGVADSLLGGATYSTADTVRPALQLIKTRPGAHLVSSCFILQRGEELLAMGDCAINISYEDSVDKEGNVTVSAAQKLAEVAIETARTAKIFGIDPKVAMLSFSTNGSGKGRDGRAQPRGNQGRQGNGPRARHRRRPAARRRHRPHRRPAQVPRLQGGRLRQHLHLPRHQRGQHRLQDRQRLGNYAAYGPILLGLNAPINDLSRGCNAQEVYSMAIITAALA